jgi:hypothetical protein
MLEKNGTLRNDFEGNLKHRLVLLKESARGLAQCKTLAGDGRASWV